MTSPSTSLFDLMLTVESFVRYQAPLVGVILTTGLGLAAASSTFFAWRRASRITDINEYVFVELSRLLARLSKLRNTDLSEEDRVRVERMLAGTKKILAELETTKLAPKWADEDLITVQELASLASQIKEVGDERSDG